MELTKICQEVTGNSIKIKKVVQNRSADIPIYITDNSKVNKISSWNPKYSTKDIILDIFEWLRENESNLKKILS